MGCWVRVKSWGVWIERLSSGTTGWDAVSFVIYIMASPRRILVAALLCLAHLHTPHLMLVVAVVIVSPRVMILLLRILLGVA
jgi:hypothetical protein